MPSDRTCVTCGTPLPRGSHATRIYCGPKCKRQTTYSHVCGWCGREFTNRASKQKFCNHACEVKARGPRPPKPDNAICGFCGKSLRLYPYRLRLAKVVYCSTACMGHGRVKPGPRKPNVNQLPSRLRLEIWERDGFVCQICGEPCDRTVGPHHPRAPTVDHIIPRSVEVINEPWNLQTAHKSCNCRKSDKVGGVSWRTVNSA